MHDYETKGYTQYGAQMGRNRREGADDYLPADTPAKLHLRRVRLDQGGYDRGGAYWGLGEPIYCAWDGEGRTRYLRARDRQAARAQFPAARFYR